MAEDDRTNEIFYGRPLGSDGRPHAGDGNVGTGSYGANPFELPPASDPYVDPRGGEPQFGVRVPLKKQAG